MKLHFPVLPETRRLYQLHLSAARKFRAALSADDAGSAQAREYLEARGFGPGAWAQFALGYCDGVSPELNEVDALLGRSPGSSTYLFRRRLIFPLFDHAGRVTGFAARTLTGDGAKYHNSPESPIFHKGDRLYGLTDRCKDTIRARGRVVLVEGYTDVMRMQLAGMQEVVCSMGTAFTPIQAEVLSRYTNVIITLFDGDQAGRLATQKAASIVADAGLQHVAAAMPEGLDPDDYVARYGIQPLTPYLDELVAAANKG